MRIVTGKSIIIAIVLIHVACWWTLKPVPPKTDDLVYTELAKQVLSGDYHLTDSPKNHRLALIYPAAFLIYLFGDHPYSISLISLLCSLATIVLVFIILEKSTGLPVAGLASFLLGINTLQINYASALFPDVIVSFYMLMCIVCLYEGRKNKKGGSVHAVLFVLFFMIGFFSKEIILFILPFTMAIGVNDVLRRQYASFWKKLLSGLLFSVGITMFFYRYLTGSWFFLYESVNKNHNEIFIPLLSALELLKRITYQPILWLIDTVGFVFLFILAVPAIFVSLKKEAKGTIQHWLTVYFLFLLGTYWFGSSSFTRMAFIPMQHYERMWIPLLAPLCILAAGTVNMLSQHERKKTTAMLLAVVFLVLAAVNYFVVSKQRSILFIMFGFACLGISFLRNRFPNRKEVVYAIAMSPFVVLCIYFLWTNSNRF